MINNNGGGIFDHLPIADFPDLLDKYFITPHNLRFERVAEQFELSYRNVRTISDLEQQYRHALLSGKSAIIEATVDRVRNLEFHEGLLLAIGAALNE